MPSSCHSLAPGSPHSAAPGLAGRNSNKNQDTGPAVPAHVALRPTQIGAHTPILGAGSRATMLLSAWAPGPSPVLLWSFFTCHSPHNVLL